MTALWMRSLTSANGSRRSPEGRGQAGPSGQALRELHQPHLPNEPAARPAAPVASPEVGVAEPAQGPRRRPSAAGWRRRDAPRSPSAATSRLLGTSTSGGAPGDRLHVLRRDARRGCRARFSTSFTVSGSTPISSSVSSPSFVFLSDGASSMPTMQMSVDGVDRRDHLGREARAACRRSPSPRSRAARRTARAGTRRHRRGLVGPRGRLKHPRSRLVRDEVVARASPRPATRPTSTRS